MYATLPIAANSTALVYSMEQLQLDQYLRLTTAVMPTAAWIREQVVMIN